MRMYSGKLSGKLILFLLIGALLCQSSFAQRGRGGGGRGGGGAGHGSVAGGAGGAPGAGR